jgi:hypothetical protein
MKRRELLGLAGLMGVAGIGTAVAQPPPPPYAAVPEPRPETPPPPPRPDLMWEPGHWHWDGVRYVWVPGHYIGHRQGRWVPGRWVWAPGQGRWIWRPAHWE